MRTADKMFNRQLGRNAQRYAEALASLETAEARYPHLRTLVGVIEQSRPEWITVGKKDELFAELIRELGADLPAEEVAQAIHARDLEFRLAAQAAKTPKEATDEEKKAAQSEAKPDSDAASDEDKPKTAARAKEAATNPAETPTPVNQADAEANADDAEEAAQNASDSEEEE